MIVRYDELFFHERDRLDNSYIEQLGLLTQEVRKQKLSNDKLTHLVSLINSTIRSNQPVRINELLAQVEQQFARQQERILSQDTVMCEIPEMSDEDSREMLELYELLLQKLHPLLHQPSGENQQHLYQRAVRYFRNYDLIGLKVLAQQTENWTTEENHIDVMVQLEREDDLMDEISRCRRKLDSLLDSYPFNRRELLEDKEAVERLRKDLESQLEQLKEDFEYYMEMIRKTAEG